MTDVKLELYQIKLIVAAIKSYRKEGIIKELEFLDKAKSGLQEVIYTAEKRRLEEGLKESSLEVLQIMEKALAND